MAASPSLPTSLTNRAQTLGEEIANSITHGVGLAAAAVLAPVLLVAAMRRGDPWHVAGVAIYGATLVLMYLVSTLYHACPAERRARAKQRLRMLDHSVIYLFIAGSYTPFLLGALRGAWGWSLLGAEWGMAAVGIAAKLRWGFRWPRLSTGIYLGMGWFVLIALKPLVTHLSPGVMAWLVASGVCYTAGVAFYATDARLRYGHAVWHLFVAGGTACHALAVWRHAAT